jgi:hypothetical protein
MGATSGESMAKDGFAKGRRSSRFLDLLHAIEEFEEGRERRMKEWESPAYHERRYRCARR